MKFIAAFFLIALLSFAACLYLPWWSIAVVSFIVLFIIRLRSGYAFLCGFCSLFLLWGALAFFISRNNGDILAHKMSITIIKLDNPFLLILITALIGGLVAGLAALSASLCRQLVISED